MIDQVHKPYILHPVLDCYAGVCCKNSCSSLLNQEVDGSTGWYPTVHSKFPHLDLTLELACKSSRLHDHGGIPHP